MNKWRLALMSMGWILGIMVIVWLVYSGISHTTLAIPLQHEHFEMSHDKNDQQKTQADIYFLERARATEAGFKAALPLHK